jgi:hypothetical protein
MVLLLSRQVTILTRQNRVGIPPLAFRKNRQVTMKAQAVEKKVKLLLQLIPEPTKMHTYVGMQEQSWQLAPFRYSPFAFLSSQIHPLRSFVMRPNQPAVGLVCVA